MTDVIGLKQLKKRLSKLSDKEGRSAIRKALRGQAKNVHQAVREEVPVDTGNLRRSIAISVKATKSGVIARIGPARKKRGKGAQVTVTADGWYAHFVEYGTARGQRPNPFMRRAWEREKSRIDNNLRRDLLAQIIKIARSR